MNGNISIPQVMVKQAWWMEILPSIENGHKNHNHHDDNTFCNVNLEKAGIPER